MKTTTLKEERDKEDQMESVFSMTNDELDKAIDTAARHSGTCYGHEACGHLMIDHLQKLIDLQLRRAKNVKD